MEILKLLSIEETERKVFQGATVQDLTNTSSNQRDMNCMPKAFPEIDFSAEIVALADEVKAYTKEINTKIISRDEVIESV